MNNEEHRKEEKLKRMKSLMDELMSEMVDEVVDDKTLDLLEKNLRKSIIAAGLVYNAAAVKVFLDGFEFCMSAMGNMGPQGAVPILLGTRKIIKALEAPGLEAVEQAMKRTKEKGDA